MEDMHLILRWHGEKDPISLRQYAQIPNLYGIVTSLYHLPLGQVWDRAEVLRLKEQIEAHGLKFELVDSFRIHEDIKRGYASRDALIENYRKNIRMLAECGIRIICYNFMPVFDWTRTDLAHVLPDGSDCLSFEEEKVRAVDPERGIELPGWGTNHTPAELQACCTATGASGRRSCGTTAAISSGRCSRWRRSAASSWPSTPTTRRGPSSACRASPRTPRTTGASSSPPTWTAPATPSPSAAAPWAPARTTICPP